jgi:two-component system sensor histidine kinase KdpD
MQGNKKLLQALIKINGISFDKSQGFNQKLQNILLEILDCMQAKRGSIMLVKGRQQMEIMAATDEKLIGLKQNLNKKTPSTWVVKNQTPLYVGDIKKNRLFKKRYSHYTGSAFLLVPIKGDGKTIGVLNVTEKIGKDVFSKEEQEVLLDIAGQVISALENQRLTESLVKKRKILQKKNLQLQKLEKLKADLFNMLIHDLKGPLAEVVANLDILSYLLSGENLDYVKSGQLGCDTLFRLVSNLLDIARLEENKLELLFQEIDPQDITREAAGRMFGVARAKGLTMVEKFSPSSGPELLRADREILLRILQNLISNAIQYSPASGTIEVGFEYCNPREITFFIQDQGPGIAAQYHNIIFDKFEQIGKKAEGRIYTTGLGLTFCKMAVESHGGRIGVESDGVRGSRFFFNLPLGTFKQGISKN